MVRISSCVGLCLFAAASAFPHFARDIDFGALDKSIDSILKRVDINALQQNSRERRLSKRASTWSPDQLVDVTGAHAYAPPTSSQTRGPCPGLNVLSNHGYFDRSGNTNLEESVNALTSVFNMGIDTAVALVAYSIAIIGDPVALTWSIGRSPGASALLPGLLSPPGGIDQSHNSYESDASVTRGDSYLHNGDVWSVQIESFKALYALQPITATANYNQNIIIAHRLVVATAAHNFVPYFFSNHSAESPDGILNQANLSSFFGVTGDSVDSLVWTAGTERIPDNWYHSPNPYTLVDVVAGVLEVIKAVPAAGKIGGNTGTVNSFTGVDIANLTGGVLSAETLLEGNNLFCFAYGAARAGLPSVLGGVASLVGSALRFLDSKLGGLLTALDCPELNKYNLDVFSQFPGSG